MTNNDIRLFIEVTKRDAEEAFRRQLEESNRVIEKHIAASRICCGERSLQPRSRFTYSAKAGFSE